MVEFFTSDLLWVVEGGMVCGIAMLIMYAVCKVVSKFFE